MKNGEELTYGGNLNVNDGNLVFDSPSVFDIGYYQCIASNQYGKAMSTVTKAQFICKSTCIWGIEGGEGRSIHINIMVSKC